MASSNPSVSRETSPVVATAAAATTTEHHPSSQLAHTPSAPSPPPSNRLEPDNEIVPNQSTNNMAKGAFEPEKEDHMDHPNGGYYAGSRKDFPLPASRHPLAQPLLEPEPGAVGGRQRHYTDDPNDPHHGFWTEDRNWVDWPPKNDSPQHGEGQEDEAAALPLDESLDKSSSDAGTTITTAATAPTTAATTTTEQSNQDTSTPNVNSSANANASSANRRQTANGTIGSVYSGNKIRHLKKDDGIPLWRKDIQFKFLKLVFEDDTPVFTRFSDGEKNLPFAEIYRDAMARSSKTSKILEDKLQTDRPAAINIAMVCLLVNFGRMNTTLNFFPEMRARLRTYHSIPSLQAHQQDSNAYKQLQDAPRLKSILKGASEDTDQPTTIEKIKELPVPRTNPVNLIFVLSNYAPKISEIHFDPPTDFFDLVMRATLSSKSRAKAFLWLMWYYLEGDFSEDAALNNPFGAGVVGEGTDGFPLKVPTLDDLTEEEADGENMDTPEEIQYGEEMQRDRKRILQEDDVVSRHIKRPKKDYLSDDQASGDIPASALSAHTSGGKGDKLAVTPGNSSKRPAADDDDEDMQTPVQSLRRPKRPKRDSSTQRSSTNQSQPTRIVLKTKMDQTPDTASPAPPGAGHPILNQFGSGSPAASQTQSSRRPRPLTQHQLAVEQHRRQRVDYIIAKRRADALKILRARRENEIPFVRAGRLLQNLPVDYDTDDENSWGKGGLCPNPEEEEDFGEAASFYLSVVRKVARRLHRWDWHSVASDDKSISATGLSENYNAGLLNGTADKENDAQPPPASSKAKSRSGGRRDRKTVEAVPDPSEPTAPAKKPSGRRRPAQEGGRKRTRPSRAKGAVAAAAAAKAAAAAAAAAEAAADASTVTPKRDDAKASEKSHSARQTKDTENDEDAALDDIDKELLGELSPVEGAYHHSPTPPPARASVPKSSPPDRHAHVDVSKVKHDPVHLKRGGFDSDDLSEDGIVSSIHGVRNGYSPGLSSSIAPDGAGGERVDEDGDEIMSHS